MLVNPPPWTFYALWPFFQVLRLTGHLGKRVTMRWVDGNHFLRTEEWVTRSGRVVARLESDVWLDETDPDPADWWKSASPRP